MVTAREKSKRNEMKIINKCQRNNEIETLSKYVDGMSMASALIRKWELYSVGVAACWATSASSCRNLRGTSQPGNETRRNWADRPAVAKASDWNRLYRLAARHLKRVRVAARTKKAMASFWPSSRAATSPLLGGVVIAFGTNMASRISNRENGVLLLIRNGKE
jgi:hypothetical protein